jgi:hypothetical protein
MALLIHDITSVSESIPPGPRENVLIFTGSYG